MKEFTFTITITGSLNARNEDEAEDRANKVGEWLTCGQGPGTKAFIPRFSYDIEGAAAQVEELS